MKKSVKDAIMNNILSEKFALTIKDFCLGTLVVLGFWGFISLGFAQNNVKINTVNDIRFAPHPLYTRIIFDLDKKFRYKIIPDFKNGMISIIFENSMLSEKLKGKIVSDKRIASINMAEPVKGEARFDIKLKYAKNTFFHMPMKRPPRLVFDIKNKTQIAFKDTELKLAKAEEKETLKTLAGKKIPSEQKKAEIETETEIKVKEEDGKTEKPAEKDDEKLKAAIEEKKQKLEEESEIILARRQDEGRAEFSQALKIYQSLDYSKARQEFSSYLENFPKGKYREDVMFLKAETAYKILTKDPKNLHLQPIIDAYELAFGMYPGSKYEDMALYRMAEVYNKMGLRMESNAHFKIILDKFPEGRYALRARLRRAQILMEEKDYEFAYKELLKVVKKEPTSEEARDATFQIASFYYDNRDYKKAIKIYGDAVKKWPTYAQFHPNLIYNIGESYFMLENVKKAQLQFFTLVNLYPDHELTTKSLNRIGEIYRMAKKNKASAKVFQETIIRKPESKDADYSLIRIADLGVIDPDMRFNNLIFNYDSFYNPLETYKNISKKHPQTNLAQMALLREGIAHAEEKSYTLAINKYKKLLTTFPDIAIKENVYTLIRESFYRLVDTYYNQKGYLPILVTYHQNLRPYLKEIDNPLVLFRIGESYQSIGLYDLALVNYQKAKIIDKKGILKEPLILNVARIFFTKKDYKKTEESMRKFIKHFAKSKHIKEAMQILADSLYRQGKYTEAVTAYTRFLKRFPKTPDVSKGYYFLADSYYQQKKYREAIKRYEFSIKLYTPTTEEKESSSHFADSYFKIGECYFKIKEYSMAVQMYQKAIEKNPDDERVSLARYIIAKSYNILDQGENAIIALQGIEKKPENEIINRVANTEIELIAWKKKFKEYFE